MTRNVQTKLRGWRARVRKGSKYDSHTYLDLEGKEYMRKGEVRQRGVTLLLLLSYCLVGKSCIHICTGLVFDVLSLRAWVFIIFYRVYLVCVFCILTLLFSIICPPPTPPPLWSYDYSKYCHA